MSHGTTIGDAAPCGNPNPVLIRGEVVTTSVLMLRTGASRATVQKWKEAGLQPLNTGTREEMYLSDDIIDVWRRRPK